MTNRNELFLRLICLNNVHKLIFPFVFMLCRGSFWHRRVAAAAAVVSIVASSFEFRIFHCVASYAQNIFPNAGIRFLRVSVRLYSIESCVNVTKCIAINWIAFYESVAMQQRNNKDRIFD